MFSRTVVIVVGLALTVLQADVGAYDYCPNDFAVEYVSYVQGTGVGFDILSFELYNDPCTALGRPTLQTTGTKLQTKGSRDFVGYGSLEVNPVHPAWRAYEIVTIGNGGELVVKFDHLVANDENNLYGIDFIVFGNARMHMFDRGVWDSNSDPETMRVTGAMFEEPGIVSVSPDGETWYTYGTDWPRADSFAPTSGYEWDEVNDVWAEELDPTRPIDPVLDAVAMTDMTVAEVIELYDGSAGGAGFDIGVFGLDWIQYVRIQDDPAMGGATTEIDAVADVSCCGDYRHPVPFADLNEDCRVGYEDLELVCSYWLYEITEANKPAAAADLYEDYIVDFYDFALLAVNWRSCTYNCEEY